MIGCLRTRVHKQPIIALYFESENELKFYNLKARVRFDRIISKGVNYLPNKAVIADRSELDEYLKHLGLVLTKPVFGISDKVTFKPISSATKTS